MPEYSEGQVLAERFEIVGVLGRGGMATVYLARDRVRGERVALKLLHDHLAQDPGMRERLRREVLAAARLRHPGALVAHELHDLDGAWGLSLPFHPGETLAEAVVGQGPMEPEALRRLGARLAEVLAEAHERGILHRDVTPQNIMLGPRGEPVLTDFGLARLRDGRSTRGTGMLGTTGYAAPEVYDGVRADPRSDLYGLGAVLYLAATGKAAYEADSPMAALRRQLEGAHTPVLEARPGLPADLADTIEALLQRDPAKRPQGARDVVEALQQRRAPEAHAPLPEPQEPSGDAQPGTALQRAELPAGGWTVLVRRRAGQDDKRHERRARRAWRHARRRAQGRLGSERWSEGWGADPGRVFSEVVGVGGDFIQQLIEGDGGSPERYLADAVATEAELPEGALAVAPAFAERRFRLVEGVDRAAAERLAVAGQQAGYRARLLPAGVAARSQLGKALGPVFPGLIMFAVSAFVLSGAPAALTAAIGMIFMLSALTGVVLQAARKTPDQLPLAYPRQLSGSLSADYEHLAPRIIATPEGPVEAPSPAAAPPTTRGGQVLARVEAALAALERAIDQQREQLPELALSELEGTLSELRAQARRLAGEVERLEAELRELERQDPEGSMATAQARLARLDTLERSGEAPSPADRRRLQAELAALAEACATSEALEARLTATLARLLDIGGTASRARRSLLEEPEPARSLEKLGEQLKRQAAAAARARRELGG